VISVEVLSHVPMINGRLLWCTVRNEPVLFMHSHDLTLTRD